MIEIKYLYFEIKYIKGVGKTKPAIQNTNVLMIKPNTNSTGYYGFTNITERKGFNEPTFSIVEQNWIDLEKFKEEKHKLPHKLKKQVHIVLESLKYNKEI